jgi:hypothetical protein
MRSACPATRLALWAAVLWLLFLGGCASRPPQMDYTAFLRSRPASLLVLPPVNESPEISATPGVWSHATRPLAEAGYYVLPVTLVDETLRQNGVTMANDAHDIPVQKLRDVFGADAAVYLKVRKYGSSYKVLNSETRVELEGRIIDLRSGELLWQGSAAASSAEQQQQTQGGLIGLLVVAIIKQVVSTSTDESYNYAGLANARLLSAPRFNGILPGPRSPRFGQPLAIP